MILLCVSWFDDNEMQANPDKFQGIAFGKTHSELKNFNINGNVIDCTDSVKLLGITFDWQLKFDKHIDDICSKASKQINVLARLSKKLDINSKMAIFRSFITSNFTYCPLVWMCCGKRNTDRIERLQYRALKFVFNDYTDSYDNLLARCKQKPLSISRIQKVAI